MAQNFNLQLNIGFNDKDTKCQIIDSEQAIDIVLDIVNDIIGDCTVLPTVGTYTHDDGHRVRERGCQVTACIFDTTISEAKNLLAKASQRIGRALNQEAIVTNVTNLTSELTPVIY